MLKFIYCTFIFALLSIHSHAQSDSLVIHGVYVHATVVCQGVAQDFMEPMYTSYVPQVYKQVYLVKHQAAIHLFNLSKSDAIAIQTDERGHFKITVPQYELGYNLVSESFFEMKSKLQNQDLISVNYNSILAYIPSIKGNYQTDIILLNNCPDDMPSINHAN